MRANYKIISMVIPGHSKIHVYNYHSLNEIMNLSNDSSAFIENHLVGTWKVKYKES